MSTSRGNSTIKIKLIVLVEDPKMLSLICYIENLTDKKVRDYCSIPIEQFFSDIMAILIRAVSNGVG
jgi:hypothetical protein